MEETGRKQIIDLGDWNHNTKVKRICKETINEVSGTFLNSEDRENWLDYAPEFGHEEYKTSLAEFLTNQYGGTPVDSSDLLPSYGAGNGLIKLAGLLFNPGTFVFCENPSYGPSIHVLQELGMNLIPIKVDSDGIIVDELEEKLKTHMSEEDDKQPRKSPYKAMLYLIPVIQNPTGCVLTDERCRRIILLARKYSLLVACDDVYNMYFGDEENPCEHPPKRLCAYEQKVNWNYGIGHVVSIGTFSKILAPSLRIGWLEAPRYVIETIASSGEYLGSGSPAGYMQRMMATAIKTGQLEKFLSQSKIFYRNHMAFFVSLLQKYFPDYAKYSMPKGGFFVWICLPESFSAQRLSEACAKHGIIFQSGSKYSVDGSFDNCFRLCPSMSSEDELEFAVKIIAEQITYLHSLLD